MELVSPNSGEQLYYIHLNEITTPGQSHKLWWRKEANGYTYDIRDAMIVDEKWKSWRGDKDVKVRVEDVNTGKAGRLDLCVHYD